jgi:hypothetical protein
MGIGVTPTATASLKMGRCRPSFAIDSQTMDHSPNIRRYCIISRQCTIGVPRLGVLGLSWIFWISLKAVFEVVLVVKTRGREFNTFTTIYFPAILRDRCFMFLRSYLIGDVPWYSWKSMLLWGVCVFVMVTKMHPTLVVFYSQGLLRSMIHGPSPSGVVGWLKHLGFEWFNLELGSALGILVASVLQSVGMACFGVDISALH